ncbi:MAG: hypothetical protein QMD61_02015 [Methanobacterium sp.]|nr:hypothetical protein [Methanobacterium sp.]
MIKITLEKEKILRSLKELESEFNKGKIPQRHYEVQKRQLEEKLEAFEVANRVRRLQGKETAEVPLDDEEDTEEENEELFKKYITSPGLKEKKLEKPKDQGRISQNKMIGIALLAAAFLIGIVFGSFNIDLPTDAANTNLFTNESAFPPFVLNNTTNTTNMTNTTRNATKIVKNTTKKTVTPPKTNTTPTPEDPSGNDTGGAGEPGTTKTIKNNSNYN